MMRLTRVDARSRATTTPWFVWASALLVALLRSLPFVQALVTSRPGMESLPVGFIAKDWFAYAALIRRVGEDGLLLVNPFTTQPHDGRILLLFHGILGQFHALTGIDPLWLLELSRWPLTVVFALLLWRLLVRLFDRPDHARWAFLLGMFSGGLEFPVQEGLRLLIEAQVAPVRVWNQALQDLWHLYGWNTYQSAFNPLWLCGLIGILGFAGGLGSDARPGGPAILWATLGFVALWFTHTYSAMAVLGIAGGIVAVRWIGDGRFPVETAANAMRRLGPGLALAGAASLWQAADPVFRGSAGSFFGTQAPSAFWLPLTLGVPGLLAVRGWLRGGPPRRRDLIAGWTVAAAMMAVSPVINGYHFVYLLHIPVCIAAAPVLAERVSQGRLAAVVLCVLLFASTVFSTVQAARDVGGLSEVPSEAMALIRDLADEPPGNVLAPPEFGNIIPAFSTHRVWVGHWFMTPGFQSLAATYQRWFGGAEAPVTFRREILHTLSSQRIRWVVLPSPCVPAMKEALAGVPFSIRQFGAHALVAIGD